MRDGPARLAALLGSLSLATDLADGFPREKSLRTCLLAMRIADAASVDEDTRCSTYYGALLRFLGCTGFAHEEANHYGGGDDIQLRRTMAYTDDGQPLDAVKRIVGGVGKGTGRRRVGAVLALASDRSAPSRHHDAQCDAGRRLGDLIAVPEGARVVLDEAFERWDGAGRLGLAGEAIALPGRIVMVADVLELFAQRYGPDVAAAELRTRAGGQLDPALATLAADAMPSLTAGVFHGSVWDEVLDAEPGPPARLSAAGFDGAALAFARYADLKSVWTLTHSTGVAELAERAGEVAGLDAEARDRLRRAGWLHDLGRVAVPNGVWDKAGPLNPAERQLMETHSYETDRILRAAPLLAEVAALAGSVHERSDGSGYHRGVPAGMLGEEARLLAAADALHAMGEARPHRPAFAPDDAARMLSADAGTGRLDVAAVRAVLEAAGASEPSARPEWPDGLSEREVDVLRHVARGASNKEIAADLGITPKTVAHHVAHIYDKVGVRSRAGAALYAIEHRLLPGR